MNAALERLKTLSEEQLTVQDYLSAKSGRDEFSSLSEKQVIEALTPDTWQVFVQAFDKDKYQLSAARWHLRGLSVERAIRKVQLEREDGHAIAERLPGVGWDGYSMPDCE